MLIVNWALAQFFKASNTHLSANGESLGLYVRYINTHSSQPPFTSAFKGNSNFEILLVKIFSVKQKANQILPAAMRKIKFFLFKRTASCSFRRRTTIENCKTKAIYAGRFRHIHAYSDIWKYTQKLFRHIQNPV